MQYNKDEVKKRFLALPDSLKSVMVSVKTSEAIKNIGDKNKLSIEQAGIVAEVVGLYMVGMVKPTELMQKIKDEIKVDNDTAFRVVEDLNTEIFSEIRDAIKIAQELKIKNEVEKETPLFGTQAAPVAPKVEPSKDEILKEIEDKNEVPAIFEGMATPSVIEEKAKQEIFRAPSQTNDHSHVVEDQKYPGGLDPYRELPE
jgi:hypothetical protein